jgi:integrase
VKFTNVTSSGPITLSGSNTPLHVRRPSHASGYNAGYASQIVAVPCEDALLRFKSIAQEVLDPNPLIPTFATQVRCFSPGDTLPGVLEFIRKHDFSQVVVRRSDGRLSMITVEGVTKWFADEAAGNRNSVTKATLDAVLSLEPPGSFVIMGSDKTIFDAADAFTNSIHLAATRLYAIVITENGGDSGEAYKLRWECVSLNEGDSTIQIAEGKSKAARRLLPLVPEVYRVLHGRWESHGRPSEGWVFPAGSLSGHLEESSAKIQHGDAIRKLQAGKEAFDQWKKEGCHGDWQEFVGAKAKLAPDYVSSHAKAVCGGVRAFEPYCLRHTALTRLAEAGCDAFTLARIAGHSSITITQRYCHPQAEAIEAAFGKLPRMNRTLSVGCHKRGRSLAFRSIRSSCN